MRGKNWWKISLRILEDASFFFYLLEATVGKLLAEIKNRITFDAVDRSTENIMRRQDC